MFVLHEHDDETCVRVANPPNNDSTALSGIQCYTATSEITCYTARSHVWDYTAEAGIKYYSVCLGSGEIFGEG